MRLLITVAFLLAENRIDVHASSHALVVVGALLLTACTTPHAVNDWDMWRESTNRVPQDNWMQYASAEDAGWSSVGLAQAREYYESLDSAALFVVHDGVVLAAWGDTERRYFCHSIRKSFLSALYGVYQADGALELQKTLAELGIDDNSPLSAAEKTATIEHLLKSRSGVYHTAAYETARARANRPARHSHAPGTFWYYNNWDFNALGTIFNQETGGDIFTAFAQRIAQPLGMQDYEPPHGYYHMEAHNSQHPAYRFRMSARDMARFGLLYLRDGRWRDKQILPSDWVHLSTKSYSPTGSGGYGYMWWVLGERFGDLQAYAALGYGGHAIYVIPRGDLVVVHRVDTFRDLRVTEREREELLDKILSARTSAPSATPNLVALPETPAASPLRLTQEQLRNYAGEYALERFSVHITKSDSGLEISSPFHGRYRLLPQSERDFMVEDAEIPLQFEFGDENQPTSVRIWMEPGAPVVARRIDVKD